MPLFDFECEFCGKRIEAMVSRFEQDLNLTRYCEKCKKFSMKKVEISPIHIKPFKGQTPKFYTH